MWTFHLPPLHKRPEDIEPNLDYEPEQFARIHGTKVTFNKEARERFLKFAISSEATWAGNFRDLNAAVTRMATLTQGGRMTVDIVEDEIHRLRSSWTLPKIDDTQDTLAILTDIELSKIDPFDRVQLAEVVRVCQESSTLSEASRNLFAVSRTRKAAPNDADRLRKYLARFGLNWARVTTNH